MLAIDSYAGKKIYAVLKEAALHLAVQEVVITGKRRDRISNMKNVYEPSSVEIITMLF